MTETTIKLVVIGNENKVYSVGKIVFSEKENSEMGKMEKDIYVTGKIGDIDFHDSRHDSGEMHWVSSKLKHKQLIGTRQPMENFKGIDLIFHQAFGLGSLPNNFQEYKIKKYDAVFCIDLREYKNKAFNMGVVILTEEGLGSLLTMFQSLINRQMYIFPDCKPMVAIVVGNTRIQNAKPDS